MLILNTPVKTQKTTTRPVLLAVCFCLLLTAQSFAVGTWTALTRLSPNPNNGVMLLMTDGSVLCHTTAGDAQGDGTIWDRLTPDSTGSYVNGTWTSTNPMTQSRYSFSSAVLKDGRVYAAGGEYGTDGTQNGWHGEVYNLVTNTWTEIAGSNSTNVMSDGNCILLDNGDILQALVDVAYPVHTVFFNPTTNAYTAAPSTLHGQNESMWVKLPDNSILFVDEGAQTSERYIPSLNQWVADANVPVALYDTYGDECGPGLLLPDGRVFFIGATNHTTYYTPSGTNAPGTFTAGPDVPSGRGMPDAPGAMMVDGKILIAVSAQPTAQVEAATPTYFYEFDYLTNTYTLLNAPGGGASLNVWSQQCNFLNLPNGQVLFGVDQLQSTSQQYYVYTPSGTPLAAGKPVINKVMQLSCNTFEVTGTGFNGISAGSAFGDENEDDSNYPIFRFTQGGRVYYARSYNWNSTGVQRGNKPDTAYITVPNSMGSGNYSMFAVANGIASDAFPFVDSLPSLSSPLNPVVCTGTNFTYTPASTTIGATFTWTRAAVAGISNAAITTPQTGNPNETLVNTTTLPVTVVYSYVVSHNSCVNTVNVNVTVNPSKPTAAFTAVPTTACSLPDSVIFTNTSTGATNYKWSFGDNNTSTSASPVYAYNAGGTYTVKLVATSACGADSVTQAGLISITPPAAPVAVTSPVNISCSGTATLNATGTDSLKWFSQATGGTVLGTGTSFITPVLNSNTTYYVADYATSAASYCPPLSDAFGTGSNFTGANAHAEIFNVNLACTLVSVQVVSGATGNRTIQLLNAQGSVLQTATVNIATGTVTVPLNFPLTPGIGYQLTCGDGTNATNLYRNATGAAYPYNDPSGYISITGNDIPDAVHFYYFYDWKLQGPSCVSARTPVNVNITNGLTLNANITNVACNGGANGSAVVTPAGGTPVYTYAWSNGQTTGTLTNVAAASYTVTVHDASGCSGTASETIGQPSALNVSVTPTNASCGGSTGIAAAAVTGGTATYSYLWSNAATTATATGLAPATYHLTVTDAHSCSATAQVVIGSSGALNLTPSSTNVACNGAATGTAGITETGGTGNITYLWSNGATTASLTNIIAGTYNVTVSDAGGCSGTSSASVSQPTALNVSVSSVNSGCGSPNGSAQATVSGGTTGYTYLWSNAATTASITGLSAATYGLTVTDHNQCSTTSSAVIANSGLLNLTATPSAGNCSGGATGGATVSVTGGTAPFTYSWSNGTTTASISGVVAATYFVTVSDNSSCSGTASVVVSTGSALAATKSATGVNCFNDVNGQASVNVTSGNSPYTYSWSNGNTTNAITNVVAGNYVVTITDAHSCTLVDTVTISQPSAITIFVSAVQPTCAGQANGTASVSALGGTPGYSYVWSNTSTALSISNLSSGSYSVTLTDANQCTSSSTFNITDPAAVTANTTASDDSCAGQNNGFVVANATGGTIPYTYLWSNSSTSAIATGLVAGPYTVTVTDIHNCTATASAIVHEPAAINGTTTTVPSVNSQANGSATVTGVTGGVAPYTVTWSNGATGNTATGLVAATYTATITDHNGCTSTVTAVVSNVLGITNVSAELAFTIYPNPAKNEITISAGNLYQPTTMMLKDVLGQTILTQTINASTTTLNLTDYASGVYLIELVQDGKRAVRKFVIEK